MVFKDGPSKICGILLGPFSNTLPHIYNIYTPDQPISTQHCMKSIRVRSFSGQYFPAFGLNMDQKNSEYEHFSRSAKFHCYTLWKREKTKGFLTFLGDIEMVHCAKLS